MNALYSTDSDWHEEDNEERKVSDGDGLTPAVSFKRTNAPDLKNQAMGIDMTYRMSEATSLVLVAAQHKQESVSSYFKTVGSGATTTVAGSDATNTGEDSGLEQVWAAKTSATKDAFGVGFAHDLGGGAMLKAGAGSLDSNAVADLGITMKF